MTHQQHTAPGTRPVGQGVAWGPAGNRPADAPYAPLGDVRRAGNGFTWPGRENGSQPLDVDAINAALAGEAGQ